MASWHLFNQTRLQAFAIRAMGGFSVYREGLDRQSLDTAVDTLIEAFRPLIVFPEGAGVSHQRPVQPLLKEWRFWARTRLAKAQTRWWASAHPSRGDQVFVPRRYSPSGDAGDRRDRGAIDLVASPLPLSAGTDQQDIAALLSLKEIEYLGVLKRARIRTANRTGRSLCSDRWKKSGSQSFARSVDTADQSPANEDRAALDSNRSYEPTARATLARLKAIYLAQQVASYPPAYLTPPTTVTRVLETVERFEEDLTDRTRVHRGLHAVIQIGPAIEVPADKTPRDQEDPIMIQLPLPHAEHARPVYPPKHPSLPKQGTPRDANTLHVN